MNRLEEAHLLNMAAWLHEIQCRQEWQRALFFLGVNLAVAGALAAEWRAGYTAGYDLGYNFGFEDGHPL